MDTQKNRSENIIGISKNSRKEESIGDRFDNILNIFIGGNFLKAKGEIDKINIDGLNSFRFYGLKGDIYTALSLYSESINFYNKALKLKIDGKLVHNLGIAYYNMGNYKEALYSFEKGSNLGLDDSMYFYLKTLAVESGIQLKSKLKKRGYNLNSEVSILADIWFHLKDYERVVYYFNRYEDEVDICLWDVSHLIKYIYGIYRVKDGKELEKKFNHIKNCKLTALDGERDLTKYDSSYLDIKKLNYLYENIHLFESIDLEEEINFIQFGYFDYY